MRVTANQVTLARLLLLPLPVAMLYRGAALGPTEIGARPWLLAALVLFVILGLTDAVDGMLARRYGSTPLGALLDPVVDKIFVVACFGPLTDFRVVPLVLVALLFVRELGVTVLRSLALEERFSFRTSALAKLKTTMQMAGAGAILLVWIFPGRREIAIILGTGLAIASIPALIAIVRRRSLGFNGTWAAILVPVLALTRALLDPKETIAVVMLVIVMVTFVSGLEYTWGMRHVLVARFRRAPLDVVRLAAVSLAVPCFFLPALAYNGCPSLPVLVLLAAELAAGGLDNSLTQAGITRSPLYDIARAGIQAFLGAAILVVLREPAPQAHLELAGLLAWTATAVTLADLTVRSLRNLEVFRAPVSLPVPVPVPIPVPPPSAAAPASAPEPRSPAATPRA